MGVSGALVAGRGTVEEVLTPTAAEEILAAAIERSNLDGKRVLAIVPDGTRTAPIPLLFRVLNEHLLSRAAALDYLIALGTHPPMGDPAIASLLGIAAGERERRYSGVRVFNHRWDHDDGLVTIGTISAEEASA